jgi:hypothetical protein
MAGAFVRRPFSPVSVKFEEIRPNTASFKSAGHSIVTARTNHPKRPMGGTDESQ